jgi:hypothetical protein
MAVKGTTINQNRPTGRGRAKDVVCSYQDCSQHGVAQFPLRAPHLYLLRSSLDNDLVMLLDSRSVSSRRD